MLLVLYVSFLSFENKNKYWVGSTLIQYVISSHKLIDSFSWKYQTFLHPWFSYSLILSSRDLENQTVTNLEIGREGKERS